MAVGKEIRTKIGSIKNTQKITSAMEMVAASKMRKAQDRMQATKPYAERIRLKISHGDGNAIDAGVAMAFCCPVLEPHQNGLGGESPILVQHAKTGRVAAVNGQGVAPRAASIEW